MKKVVNSVLASALALSVAPMAFANEDATTTTAPAMDAELEKVVKRLEALGLVAGYGNGDYGVERTITRAEFATLIVRARNLEQGAQLAQFQSNFTDVHTSDWFSGFVNVAAGQEIVKGFPDKSFKPQNQVTYAESVAMIIRALGHEPAVRGEWPNNYIAKASELNIANNITTPNVAATRGDVFKMLDNALRVKLMEQIEYGTDIRFQITNETLLTRYLDVTVRDMDWARGTNNRDAEDLPVVTNVPVVGLGKLKANEVTLDGRNADLGSRTTYKVADSINANDYDGQHVQVWIKNDSDNTIVWMEGSTEEEVVMDRVGGFFFKGKDMKGKPDSLEDDRDLADLQIELDGSGKKYRFSEDTQVTYNFNPADDQEEAVEYLQEVIKDDLPYAVKIVLDNRNEISYIHIIDDVTMNKNVTEVKYGSKVIDRINTSSKRITNLDSKSFSELEDLEEGTDFLVFINNEPASFADLKPMDVYNVYYADGQDDKLLVFATRNVVEGEVERVSIRSDEDHRLVIGGKTYRVRNGHSTYSDDGNDDVIDITKSNQDLLKDLDGEEVKLYLDASGRIRHIETKDDITDRKFKAIVTRAATYNGGEFNFTVYNEKGSRVRIDIDPRDIRDADNDRVDEDLIESLLTPADADGNVKPMLLEVTLDKDGDATKVQILDENPVKFSGNWNNAADEDDDLLTIGGRAYEVTSDTAIFDMSGGISGKLRPELQKPKTLKWKDIADEDDVVVYYTLDESNREVQAVFVVDGTGLSGDFLFGQVLEMGTRGGTDEITVLTKDGEEVKSVTYKLDDDVEDLRDNGIRTGDFIAFQLNNADEVIVDDVIEVVNRADDIEQIGLLSEDDWAFADISKIVVGQVADVDKNRVTIAHDEEGDVTEEYFTRSSTVYFDAYNSKADDGVDEGDFVIMIQTDSDGDRFDFVLQINTEREVDRYDLNTDEFWAIAAELAPGDGEDPTDDPTEEPTNPPVDGEFVDVDSVDVTVEPGLGGALNIYTVAGEGAPGAELEITVGTRTETVTVGSNGTFKQDFFLPASATVEVVTIVATLGDEEKEYEIEVPAAEEE